MKKITAIFFFVACILAGGNAGVSRQAALPKTLIIPRLHITAHIEAVGLDNTGRMDIPKVISDVGWYMLGPRPGIVGNAVVDGHVDDKIGGPNTFTNLNHVQNGDTIIVVNLDNTKHIFKITKKAVFPTNTFPDNKVFGNSQTANLNLITCAGDWDATQHTFNKRLVVFSQLRE